MDILIHLGPHKTGTTSLQNSLLETFGWDGVQKSNYNIWYPTPTSSGPGHAELAWKILGLNGYKADKEAIKNLIDDSKPNNTSLILISSEEFSKAHPSGWGVLSEALSPYNVNVLVTLNSVPKRMISLWQERLKHGHLRSLSDSRKELFDHWGLQFDFCTSIVKNIKPKNMTIVILPSYTSPEFIFESTKRVIEKVRSVDGQSIPSLVQGGTKFLNKSIGFYESEALLRFNHLFFNKYSTKKEYMFFRNRFLLSMCGQEWRTRFPRVPISFPSEWVDDIRKLSEITIDAIYKLEYLQMVDVIGKLSDLLNVPNGNKDVCQRVNILDDQEAEFIDAFLVEFWRKIE